MTLSLLLNTLLDNEECEATVNSALDDRPQV